MILHFCWPMSDEAGSLATGVLSVSYVYKTLPEELVFCTGTIPENYPCATIYCTVPITDHLNPLHVECISSHPQKWSDTGRQARFSQIMGKPAYYLLLKPEQPTALEDGNLSRITVFFFFILHLVHRE